MPTFADDDVLYAADLENILDGTSLGAGSVGTATIADGSVTAAKISAESWTAFTPSWNNVTLGSGSTNYGRYIVYGKTVFCTVNLVLGTSGDVTGTLSMTLPNSHTTANQNTSYIGSAYATDTGTSHYVIAAEVGANDTAVGFRYNNNSVVNGSVPFDWTTGDSIYFTIIYEIA